MKVTNDVQRCTAELIGITAETANAETIDAIRQLDEYFKDFCDPTDDKCPKCGLRLGGFFGSFRWSIQHGEGECSECGWPCRGKHTLMANGKPLFNRAIFRALAYHPSVVEVANADRCEQ